MGRSTFAVILSIFFIGCFTIGAAKFNCTAEDSWLCSDGCFERLDVHDAKCITPLGATCYGAPLVSDVDLKRPPSKNFSDPLLKLFPKCYRELLPLVCTTSYVPCKNVKLMTESGEEDATMRYRPPVSKCKAVTKACHELFKIQPNLRGLLELSCNDTKTFSDTCQVIPSTLPVFESGHCPWPLVQQRKTSMSPFTNRVFDECYSPCRLTSPKLQSYEHSKSAFTVISFGLLIFFLVSIFTKSDVFRRSISGRFFVVGAVVATIYNCFWMVSSVDYLFKSVTCSADGLRFTPTANPPNFGACSWVQKLMSSFLMISVVTPLISIMMSIAGNIQTDFSILWLKRMESMENFIWLILVSCSSVFPYFLTGFFGVERDEFSGLCISGNLSTVSLVVNLTLPFLLVLLISLKASLTGCFKDKNSNDGVAFVELLVNNRSNDNKDQPQANTKAKAKRRSRTFLHKNHLFSRLTLVIVFLCYGLWLVALCVHPLVVPGWHEQETKGIFATLRCLFNLNLEVPDAELFSLPDEHRQEPTNHECYKSLLGFRPEFSFLVFVVLPVFPFIFVAIVDALPPIWNSSFGMAMWAKRKLRTMRSSSEIQFQPVYQTKEALESARSCDTVSSHQIKRNPRTSRLYQTQRERGSGAGSTTPPSVWVEQVQRLVETFSSELQSIVSDRAELREVTRIQDQTLMALGQQLDLANAQLAAFRGDPPPASVLTGQPVSHQVDPGTHLSSMLHQSEQDAPTVQHENVLAGFQGFKKNLVTDELPRQEPSSSQRMALRSPVVHRGFSGPTQLFGQSFNKYSAHAEQPERRSDSDESVPSYDDVRDLDELRRRSNGCLEEPHENGYEVAGPSGQQQQFRPLQPQPVHQLDPYGMPFPMSSVMSAPEIQLRAQVLREVLRTNTTQPVYPLQIAVILERAGVLNRVDAQRPLRPNHVIYTPDRIEAMLGTTTYVPPNLRDPNNFREHIALLAFQQGLTLAVIYRDAAGPPRSLPQILERINVEEIVPSELRELIRQGDLNAINEARQIIESSPHAIRLNLENRVHQAFLYVRDFLDSRATLAGLPPANINPVDANGAQPAQDSDSAVETS